MVSWCVPVTTTACAMPARCSVESTRVTKVSPPIGNRAFGEPIRSDAPPARTMAGMLTGGL